MRQFQGVFFCILSFHTEVKNLSFRQKKRTQTNLVYLHESDHWDVCVNRFCQNVMQIFWGRGTIVDFYKESNIIYEYTEIQNPINFAYILKICKYLAMQCF